MNDTLIIVICIFFMSIIWSFYFKKIKEGVDNIDNYVIPISFSDNKSTIPNDDKSETIHVPRKITTTGGEDLFLMKNTNVEGALNVKNNADIGGPLLVKGETTLKQEVKIPMHVPIHFGVGQNKQVDAGKISYGSYGLDDTLSIVGGGNGARKVKIWDNLNVGDNLSVNSNTTTGSLNVGGNTGVTGNTTTGSLNVGGKADVNSLKVGGNTTTISLNTNELNINNIMNIKGIQMGRVGSGHSGHKWVGFPKSFPTNNVFVFTTPEGDGWEYQTTTRVTSVNGTGFQFQQISATAHREGAKIIRGVMSYIKGNSGYPFAWIAFCI
jgi:hypothetical protein